MTPCKSHLSIAPRDSLPDLQPISTNGVLGALLADHPSDPNGDGFRPRIPWPLSARVRSRIHVQHRSTAAVLRDNQSITLLWKWRKGWSNRPNYVAVVRPNPTSFRASVSNRIAEVLAQYRRYGTSSRVTASDSFVSRHATNAKRGQTCPDPHRSLRLRLTDP